MTLREYRISKNLSQADMAKLIGITMTTYNHLENGTGYKAGYRTVAKICKATGFTPDQVRNELLTHEDNE